MSWQSCWYYRTASNQLKILMPSLNFLAFSTSYLPLCTVNCSTYLCICLRVCKNAYSTKKNYENWYRTHRIVEMTICPGWSLSGSATVPLFSRSCSRSRSLSSLLLDLCWWPCHTDYSIALTEDWSSPRQLHHPHSLFTFIHLHQPHLPTLIYTNLLSHISTNTSSTFSPFISFSSSIPPLQSQPPLQYYISTSLLQFQHLLKTSFYLPLFPLSAVCCV